MLSKNKHSIDMLNGPIFRKLLLLAVPITLASVLQQLFNTADIAVAGRYLSTQAMAAAGCNVPVIGLFINLLSGLALGANVFIAKGIALRQRGRVHAGVQTTMTIALLLSLLVVIIGLVAARSILELIATPADVMDEAIIYLRVYLLGLPFLTLYNFGSAVLRADGDSLRPLYALIAANLVNIVLDLVFTIGLGWSIGGITLATTLANGVNAAIVLYYLIHETGYLHFNWNVPCFNRECIAEIVCIGGPASLQGVVFCFSNIVLQGAINSFGSDAAAGVAAALTFEFIAYFVVNGFTQAAVTFTSQNYAAHLFSRCRRIFRHSLLASMLLTALVSLSFISQRDLLLGFFHPTEAAMGYALIRLFAATLPECLTATYEIPGACLRGMGISLLPALETLFGSCLLRVAYVFLIFPSLPDFVYLSALYPVTWVVTGTLVMSTYFLTRRHLEKKPNQL